MENSKKLLVRVLSVWGTAFLLIGSGCIGCKSTDEANAEDRLELAKNHELNGNAYAAILQLDSILLYYPASSVAKDARAQLDRLNRWRDNTRKAWNALQTADSESAANVERTLGTAKDLLDYLRLRTDVVRESGNLYARIQLLDVEPLLGEHIQNSIKARQMHTGQLQTLLSEYSVQLRELNDLYFSGQINKRVLQSNKAHQEMRCRLKLEPVDSQISTDEQALDQADKNVMQYLMSKWGLNLNDN